jgi:hypothetical protein
MQNTKNKIHEAIYFLSQAEGCEKNKDTKGIQNNLQAFISFGRSVMNILHYEITEKSRSYRNNEEIIKYQKLSDWLQKKEFELKHDTLCCFFSVRRVSGVTH